jgi:hypothetical protein
MPTTKTTNNGVTEKSTCIPEETNKKLIYIVVTNKILTTLKYNDKQLIKYLCKNLERAEILCI